MGLTKTLYEYQRQAVTSIVDHWTGTIEAINSGDTRQAKLYRSDSMRLLAAPTGSGKTVTVSATIIEAAELFEQQSREVVFVVMAPNSLNKQLHSDFVNNGVTSDGRLNDVSIEEIRNGRSIRAGDVIFTNYASVDKKKNTVIRENEQGNDLNSQFTALRNQGVNTVLVVDEAHVNYNGTNAQAFINDVVKPDMTLLVTATPHKNIPGYDYRGGDNEFTDQTILVNKADVVAAGAIVKKVVLNMRVGQLNIVNPQNDLEVDLQFVDMALTMKRRMDAAYRQEGSNVNTLVGIQIPSKSKNVFEVSDTYGEIKKDSASERNKLDAILDHLAKYHSMNVDGAEDGDENGEVAYWFAEKKTKNAEDEVIKPNDSHVDVIIFKEAIAVGWDCPRMGSMALLRENKTRPFTLQTLGRAMRQPEQKHYHDDMLNNAYVFSAHELVRKIVDEHPDAVETGEKRHVSLDRSDQAVQRILTALENHEDKGLKTYFYQVSNSGRVSLGNVTQAGTEVLEAHGIESVQFGGGISTDDWKKHLGVDCFAKNKTLTILAEQSIDPDSYETDYDTVVSDIELADQDVLREYEKMILEACNDGNVAPNKETAFALRAYLIRNAAPRLEANDSLYNEAEIAIAATANQENTTKFSRFIEAIMQRAFELEGNTGKSRAIKAREDQTWTPPDNLWLNVEDIQCKTRESDALHISTYMYDCVETNVPGTEKRYMENVPQYISDHIQKYHGGHADFRYMKNGVQGLHLGLSYHDPEGIEKLTFPDFVNFFYMNGILHVYIIEVKSKDSKLGDDKATIRAKAKALEDYAASVTTDNVRVHGKVWSFVEGDELVVEITAPNERDDIAESYISAAVDNMIEHDMNGFKR